MKDSLFCFCRWTRFLRRHRRPRHHNTSDYTQRRECTLTLLLSRTHTRTLKHTLNILLSCNSWPARSSGKVVSALSRSVTNPEPPSKSTSLWRVRRIVSSPSQERRTRFRTLSIFCRTGKFMI